MQGDTGSPLKGRNVLLKVQAALDSTQTFIGGSQFIDARVPIVTGTLRGGVRADISARTNPKDITADGGVALMQVRPQPPAYTPPVRPTCPYVSLPY